MTPVAPPSDLAPRLSGLALSEIEIPNGREEEWRFTPLKRMANLHALTTEASPVSFSVSAPQGVEVREGDVDGEFQSADRVSAAAVELSRNQLSITIAQEFVSKDAIVVRATSGASALGRLRVDAGKYSETTILLDHVGVGSAATAVDFHLADGAQMTIISVQDGDRNSVFAGQQAIHLGRDSKVKHVVVTLGGDLVRLVSTVHFTAPGGEAEMTGVYFTDAGQHHEHRLFVDHAVPNCRSDVMYKGALQGDDAHSVWVGDVLIRGNATGTSTYELNRNLLLTDGARADSVPNLEIETGEIEGAGHASASGKFDEEQIFYLTSRGIPEVQAKRLVVRGFLADVIGRIPADDIVNRLLSGVEARLGEADPLFAEVDHE
ncbi:MAG: Fe-S cluster assembly protein SufD [Actinomycetota bacterium]|jgi:Fe-S cluster assembly protein SufD